MHDVNARTGRSREAKNEGFQLGHPQSLRRRCLSSFDSEPTDPVRISLSTRALLSLDVRWGH
jgi:hypothetical protein